jgi:5-methylthioadenosine/S-adenosylhomocysteine deaminase
VSVVRLDRLHSTPATTVVSALVYSTEADDVDTVIIDGELVMRERKLLTINERETIAAAKTEAAKLILSCKS